MPGEVGRGVKYNTQMLMRDLLFAASYFARTGGRVRLAYHVGLTIFLLYHGPFWYFGLREAGVPKAVHNFERDKMFILPGNGANASAMGGGIPMKLDSGYGRE